MSNVSHTGRRYSLKSSDTKNLLVETSEKLKVDLSKFIDSKASIEAVEIGKGDLFLVNTKPVLFRLGKNVYPTLLFEEIIESLPRVVVDMGAVRHVCNGADIMAPGIVRFEGEFTKGALIIVVDVKYRKRLALGETQYNSEEAKDVKKGAVVKNVHFVSDEIWDAMKALKK